MMIGEAAHAAGVSAKTIRFWEQSGLLAQPDRTPSGYRDYQDDVVERIGFIRHAQSAGLTLAQIGQVLEIGDSGSRPCEHVSQLIKDRLIEIDQRIAELQETRSHLRVLARRASRQDPKTCRGHCSIIDPLPKAR